MKTVDMTKGSPLKLLVQFSIPILLGNLFQQAYTLADRIIVGRFAMIRYRHGTWKNKTLV